MDLGVFEPFLKGHKGLACAFVIAVTVIEQVAVLVVSVFQGVGCAVGGDCFFHDVMFSSNGYE